MAVITQLTPVSFRSDLPTDVDVVIIGAGIIGISTAWFLSQSGLRVLVCDKGRVAGEQSSRNWGWIRQQGRDQAELPIMMESIKIWQNLSEQIGTEIGFVQAGSLYLCENASQLESYDNFLGFAAQYRLDSQRLDSRQLYATIRNTPRHWNSALYTPSDARAEPSSAVPAIARACVEAGISIIEDCAIDSISIKNRQIDGVYSESGFIKCQRVLCCAGHWSSRLLADTGIDLPQLSVKASVARTAEAPLLFNGNASGSGLAFRRRQDGGYSIAITDRLEVFPSWQALKQFKTFLPLMSSASNKLKLRLHDNTANINSFSRKADYRRDQANRVLNPLPSIKAQQRIRVVFDEKLPVFRDVPIVEHWAGMIDAMPDAVPVMDAAADIDGLFIATGFSGHGFGIGPAAGKIMANLIQGKASGHDISRFRFSRFSDGSDLIMGPSI